MSDPIAGTTFDVAPRDAQWYYCATIDVHGETTYLDGYATGDKPTRTALQEFSRCKHTWVAGMMYVSEEDVESVAAIRPVICERCDRSYRERDRKPLHILEWEVEPTPTNPRYRGPQPASNQ